MSMLLAVTAASASALDDCRAQKQAEADIALCVETAQLRSTNHLRNLSNTTREAVSEETRSGKRRSRMREYRKLEARHVHERNTLCRKQTDPLERRACIADMNDAHAAELKRFME
ncbi:hypothetical protein [Paucimonas lemoignei]|uniref:hypothetical protein n=1 Tax=Paucimonas lemoignei TaxID=29443 RepID=UPI001042F949|nr:hypothetical protein [Paucimonas lemoignei]